MPSVIITFPARTCSRDPEGPEVDEVQAIVLSAFRICKAPFTFMETTTPVEGPVDQIAVIPFSASKSERLPSFWKSNMYDRSHDKTESPLFSLTPEPRESTHGGSLDAVEK